MVGMWFTAGFFFIGGWVLVLNYKGSTEKIFRFLIDAMPFRGTATPNTLRIVGVLWIFVSSGMIISEILTDR